MAESTYQSSCMRRLVRCFESMIFFGEEVASLELSANVLEELRKGLILC